jgi:hypothetical protein
MLRAHREIGGMAVWCCFCTGLGFEWHVRVSFVFGYNFKLHRSQWAACNATSRSLRQGHPKLEGRIDLEASGINEGIHLNRSVTR